MKTDYKIGNGKLSLPKMFELTALISSTILLAFGNYISLTKLSYITLFFTLITISLTSKFNILKIKTSIIYLCSVIAVFLILIPNTFAQNHITSIDEMILVTPEDFGAVGNGVTDDSQAFTKMFSASSRLHVKLGPNKTYNIKQPQISLLNADSVIIDGQGATINMNSYFLTVTSGKRWTDGASTGWWNVSLRDKALNNTLFTTNFEQGNNWIGITNPADWNVTKGDLLAIMISDASKGQTFVVDYLDPINKKLFFQSPNRDYFARTQISELRYVFSGKKSANINNLYIKNGGLRVSGFENASIENVSCEMDEYTYTNLNSSTDGNINAVAGLTAIWNKNATINGGTFSGYLITGTGYGVAVGMSDFVEIDGIEGSDCRHIVTSTAPTKVAALLNKLIIKNSKAYFTNRAFAIIPSNITAWDTHAGIDQIIIDNCYVEGAQLFSKLRGNKISITNSTAKNTQIIVYVSDAPPLYKKYISISGCNFINSGSLVYYKNASIEDLIVDRTNHQLSNTIAAIYSNGVAATIKNLSITNSKFWAESTVSRIFLNQYPSYNSVDLVTIENSEFDYITDFFYFRNSPIKKMIFNNNIVRGTEDNYFIRYQEVDAAQSNCFSDYTFTNNQFENLKMINNWGPKIKIGSWSWTNNEFINCPYPQYFEQATFTSLNVSDNTFYGNNSGYLIGAESGHVVANGNQILIDKDKTYITKLNAGELNFENNVITYNCTAVSNIHSGDATMNIKSNHYTINAPNADYANIVTGTWNFINNIVNLHPITNMMGFFKVLSASEFTFDKNDFNVIDNVNDHVIIKGEPGSTIIWGNNIFNGTTNPIDTLGVNSEILDSIDSTLTDDKDENEQSVIDSYELMQNYPNPFNPTTTIKYSIPANGIGEVVNVNLVIYDVLGRKVKTLVNEQQPHGKYSVEFNASTLNSGIYIYKLVTNNFSESKKMLLIK